MYVIGAKFCLDNVHAFPFTKLPEDSSYCNAFLTIENFSSVFRREHNMIFAIPLRSVYKELHADRETGC